MRHAPTAGFALVLLFGLAACQPSLNWREVQPPQSGAWALFPCKPGFEQRRGTGAPMGLAQCEASGARYSLAWADAPGPAEAGAALSEMPRALATKLKRPLPQGQSLAVPGMTPHPEAAQYLLLASDGVARLAVFAHGSRVYQALRLGQVDDEVAWQSFVGGLRLVGPTQGGS